MRILQYFRTFAYAATAILVLTICAIPQSGDAAFPTPVTTNEISGVIPARDIGDPRLTTYYFIFNGNRGDVFINIVTNNFNGQIDIFTAKGQEPRTKITVYADNPEPETGRVIYQRQPERLIVRIQGRTPNDDPATYQLKFAGSFAPITGAAAENTNEFPDILARSEGERRVTSTGEILPPEPKPESETIAEVPEQNDSEVSGDVLHDASTADDEVKPAKDDDAGEPTVNDLSLDDADALKTDPPPGKEAAADSDNTPANQKPVVVITDNLKPADDETREVTVDLTEKKADNVSAVVTVERAAEDDPESESDNGGETAPVTGEKSPDAPDVPNETKGPEGARPPATEAEIAAASNPLSRVFLRVELKDGTLLERRMTEVTSVNVIDGVLRIVFTDGSTREIDILRVLKMTIQ